jgi:ATP-binding cassette subfamily G (WHITE) protein 2 (PDR)
LYEGRQIYFGEIHAAKEYFINMGFECPPRQTTADFLTSITSPAERIVREGFLGSTPFTPDEFALAWNKSDDRAQLLQDIDEFDRLHPIGGEYLEKFKESRRGKLSSCSYPQVVLTCLRSRSSEVPVSQELPLVCITPY